jgi:hypothetical protein
MKFRCGTTFTKVKGILRRSLRDCANVVHYQNNLHEAEMFVEVRRNNSMIYNDLDRETKIRSSRSPSRHYFI